MENNAAGMLHNGVAVNEIATAPVDSSEPGVALENESDPLPVVPLIIIKSPDYDSKYYNKLGFYCALEMVEDPEKRYVELLRSQRAEYASQKEQLSVYYKQREERYTNRIALHEAGLVRAETNRATHLEDLPKAIEDAEEARATMLDLEAKVSAEAIKFGENKASLVTDAIESVRKNLESLIDNYRAVYQQRYAINEQSYKDQKHALDGKAEQFKKIKAQAEKQWGLLNDRMEKLGFEGLNPALANWFFYVGLAVATICGAYFFSIFALARHLGDSNIMFFVLTGIDGFLANFYTDEPMGYRILYLFVAIAVISFLITLVAWGSWKLLRVFNPTSMVEKTDAQAVKSGYQFEIGKERELSFELRAEGRSFYQFWLQILPPVALLSLVGFAVLLGHQAIGVARGSANAPSALQNLDISLTGATVGALLTLLFSGLFAIYLIKVVEPRRLRDAQHAPNGPVNLLRQNLELLLAGGAFIAALFLLLFLPKDAAGSQPSVLAVYAILVIANGFLLGFALRMKALFATLNFLERRILMLAAAIRDNSAPRPLNLTGTEEKLFRTEYFRLQRELFNLMLLKTQLANGAFGGRNANPPRKFRLPPPPQKKQKEEPRQRNLFQRWWDSAVEAVFKEKNITGPKSSKEVMAETAINLEDWEKRLYPAATASLDQLSKEMALARARSKEADEWVQLLKEERTPYCLEVERRMRRHHDAINNLRIASEKAKLEFLYQLREIKMLSEMIEADIREGFSLGNWLRREVGPELRPPEEYLDVESEETTFKGLDQGDRTPETRTVNPPPADPGPENDQPGKIDP